MRSIQTVNWRAGDAMKHACYASAGRNMPQTLPTRTSAIQSLEKTGSSSGAGLRRNYLSGIENVAQSIGTMGPVATIGTILPLLIYKSGNGTWLLFLCVLAAFWLVAANINVFASRFASAGSLSTFAQQGLGNRAGR